MKIRTIFILLVLVMFLFAPAAQAATVVISQAGADPNTVMKGMAFTIKISGLSSGDKASLILPTGFSTEEGLEKTASSSSVSWTQVVANQKLSAQTITATITKTGSSETATSNSFDVILPPSIVTSVTPSSITANQSTSHTVQLNIQNYGETIAKGVVVTISLPTGIEISSGNETQTISTIDGGAGGSGESVGRSWTLNATNPTNSTITITITPSNADSETETVTVISTVTPTPTPTPTSTPTPTPSPGSSELGGGGGGGEMPTSSDGNVPIDDTGTVTTTTTLYSTDGNSKLTIPEGTTVTDAEGGAIDMVTMSSITLGGTIAAYNLGPDGATFDPPILLTFTYNPDLVPEGKTVVMKMYDGSKWIELETTVDTATNTATAKVSHFSIFGLFLKEKQVTTESTPTPTQTAASETPTPKAPTSTPTPKTAPFSLPLIVGIIMALVVIGIVAYLFKKKR